MSPILEFILLAIAAGVTTRLARNAATAAGIPAILAGILLSIAAE
jgi:hypothetical protein